MPTESLQTLKRALAVLDCFTSGPAELGVREIARRTDLSTSVTGRLLIGLKEMGFLSQNAETRAYSLGARVLRLAEAYHSHLEVRNHALPIMQDLHQSTRETVSLYVMEDFERVCIERMESPQSVRIVTRIGQRLPLYAGSAGKVMLAYLPTEQQQKYLDAAHLEPLTENTITDRRQLQRELDSIRESGVAVSHGEWITDAAGVAAPILDRAGIAVAALAISGPASRFTDDVVMQYCVDVKRVALEISLAMGYPKSMAEANPR